MVKGMQLLNLRAIPIAHDSNVYQVNEKEMEVIKKIEYKKHFTSPGVYVSKNVSLLNSKNFSSLKKFIIKKAKEYVRDVLEIKDEIYLTQSWSTINTTNAFHQPHEHPNTFISLVYYVQCKSGALCFHLSTTSIRECFNFQYTIDKYNIYNSQHWTIAVQTGDIILFPGHIRHGSTPNKSPEPRITIGANFFIKGKLGSKEHISLMGIKPL